MDLLRDIKENLNKWREIRYKDINFLQMDLRIEGIPNQNPRMLSVEIDRLILNSYGNAKDLE